LAVSVRHKPPLSSLPLVQATAARIERELGTEGRLVLRYSGTENVARIMIEGRDPQQVDTLVGELAAVLQRTIGDSLEGELR
jgi:phosphoglucosamine mutase